MTGLRSPYRRRPDPARPTQGQRWVWRCYVPEAYARKELPDAATASAECMTVFGAQLVRVERSKTRRGWDIELFAKGAWVPPLRIEGERIRCLQSGEEWR